MKKERHEKMKRAKHALLLSLQAIGLLGGAAAASKSTPPRERDFVQTMRQDPLVVPFTALQVAASFVVDGCGGGLRAMLGCGPNLEGCGPFIEGCGPFIEGCGPNIQGCGPFIEGCGPNIQGCGPNIG